jgi:predicted ATPase/DNA-binding SARP family transcriptional activator
MKSMTQITLSVLGSFEVTAQGQPITGFATDKVRALLAFLALEPQRPHRREILAGLLWPDIADSLALTNLRQTLHRLREALTKAVPGAGNTLFTVTRQTIQLNLTGCVVDVVEFEALLTATATHDHPALASCDACLARLTQAISYYRGELLAGFGLADAAAFEEWLLLRRESLHHQALLTLSQLAVAHETRGEWELAHRYATRQLALEPYREEAHRQVMRLLARRGLVHQALAQYDACRRLLREALRVDPDPETVALVDQIRSGKLGQGIGGQGDRVQESPQLTLSPSSPVVATFAHNLPPSIPRLVGRRTELEALCRTVLQSPQRLVTLVGMGGMGKTRLALAMIEQFAADPPPALAHGAWFVPLATVEATLSNLPEALAEAIAKALGVVTSGNLQTQLVDYLARRQLLLVLDNFEHLLAAEEPAAAATAFLTDLLHAAPGVIALVTSRTPLHLAEEQLIRLDGMAVPDIKTPAAADFDSIRLFVRHAQRTWPAFAVDSSTLADIIEICRLVSGMPLAIELAATLVRHFAVAEIVDAIRENPAVLASPQRNLDERHRHLTAVFDYSWRLLSDREQQLLAQTAIFVGRFSRAAAQAITGATILELGGLVDKSLLRQPAVSLYELHELVCQFVAAKLATFAAPFNEALQSRYVRYYLGFVGQRAGPLRQRQAQAVAAQIRQESENVRHAWELALARQWVDPLVEAMDGLLHYWQATGRYHEGEALLAAALPTLDRLVAQPDAQPQWQTLLAKAWLAYAVCLYGQNNYRAALDAAERALPLAVAAGDDRQVAQTLVTIAEALNWLGRYDEVQSYGERAYALAQQHGDWTTEARSLIVLAGTRKRFAQRLALLTQALQIAQAHDDPYLELTCTQFMAGTYENAGYYAGSLPHRIQCLHLAEEVQDRYQIADAQYHVGLVHLHLGAYEQALHHFQQAIAIAQEQGFAWLERISLNQCALLYACVGQFDQAEACSRQARSSTPNAAAQLLFFDFVYGFILAGQGRWAESDYIYQRVLAHKRLRTGMAATRLLPELAELARNALQQGDLAQALAYAEEIGTILSKYPSFSLNDVNFNLYAIYLAWYQVLQAAQDPRAAGVLETSYHELIAHAEAIADEGLRRAYLENVPANRALVAAWQAAQQTGPVPVATDPPVTAAPPHNLPAQHAPLIGRERELGEIIARLQQSDVRLLTLVGAGGIGKTRLALAVGQMSLDAATAPGRAGQPNAKLPNPTYPDGIFFVTLAPLTDPAVLAPTIAAALNLELHGDPQQRVVQYLRDKRLLLILDNFEHLLEGTELVVTILQAAPAVQILATSRERLGVRGEHLYPVPPLEYLADDPAKALTSPSVRLFVHSAQQVQTDFTLDENNLPGVMRICTLVQGIPLGLELAAAWTEMLSTAEIASEIEKSVDFLAVDWASTPERQRSLRAVFDWSWQLLTPAEQQVLRQLAIFQGGFTREAAERITGASVRILTSLVQKSLLRRVDAGSLLGGRYDLHELVHQFAAKKLDEVAGEREALAARHGEFYLGFLAAREYRLARQEPRQATEELQRELDNIRQAWRWALSSPQIEALDQAIFAWRQFCNQAGLTIESEHSFALAVAHARSLLDQCSPQDPAYRQLQRLLSKLLAIHANNFFAKGDYEQMGALAEEAIRLGVASGSIEGQAFGAFVLGRAYQELGRMDEATRQYRKTIQLAQEQRTGSQASELLHELVWMGYIWLRGSLLFFGDYTGARAMTAQALHHCRTLQKVRGELTCLTNLAHVKSYLGDYAGARQDYEQALAIARDLNYSSGEAMVQYELGELLRVQGAYGQAQTLLEQGVETAQKNSLFYHEAWALADLLRLYCQVGNAERAHACRQQLEQRMTQRALTPDCQAQGLRALAVYALQTGDAHVARAHAQQSWQLATEFDNTFHQADSAIIFGHVCAALGQWADAAQAYQQAITWYQQLGNVPRLVEPQAGLAQVAWAQGDLHQARHWVEQLLPVLAAPGARPPLAGINTPLFGYLIGYRVLAANQDPRARTLLRTGYDLLLTLAAQLADEALRHSFLETIEVHRTLQLLIRAERVASGEGTGSHAA